MTPGITYTGKTVRSKESPITENTVVCNKGRNKMWKYVKRYLLFAVIAVAFMVGEVFMDLLQPEIMSKIVDDGVLGVSTGGVGNMQLIWSLGIRMIGLV